MTTHATRPTAAGPRPRRLRGRPLLYRSYAPGAGAVQHPAQAGAGSALIVLVALRRCRSCSTDTMLQTARASAFAFAIGAHRAQHRHRATPARSRSATRSSSASAPTRRPRSQRRPGRAARIGFGITNILVWLPAAGLVAARRRGARRAAGHPAARALPRHRHARAGLHRRAHLRASGATSPAAPASAGEAADARAVRLRLRRSDATPSPRTRSSTCSCWCCCSSSRWRPATSPVPGRPGLRRRPRPRHRRRSDGRQPAALQDVAFAISSFYAGCAGALLYSSSASSSPSSFNLVLSVQFIAMVLIGGAGTISRRDHGRAVHLAAADADPRAAGVPALHQRRRSPTPRTSSSSSRSSTACSSSASCCSSRAGSSASGSGSATTGRAGRSATERQATQRRRAAREADARQAVLLAALRCSLTGCRGGGDDDGRRRGISAPGVSPTSRARTPSTRTTGCIYLGTISDLTQGPFAPLGVPITDAQKAFWQRVNEDGGIGGYDIDVTKYVKDNLYNPQTHKQVYGEIEGDVLALAQTLGSPTTLAIIADMKSDEMVGAPRPSWTSLWAFEDNILESGTNYCVEAMNAVDYVVGEGQSRASWRSTSPVTTAATAPPAPRSPPRPTASTFTARRDRAGPGGSRPARSAPIVEQEARPGHPRHRPDRDRGHRRPGRGPGLHRPVHRPRPDVEPGAARDPGRPGAGGALPAVRLLGPLRHRHPRPRGDA